MILAERSTNAVLCIAFCMVVPTATMPWLAMSAAPRFSSALTVCSPSSADPLGQYSVQRMSPPRYTVNSSMQLGMSWWATANIVACTACEWMHTAMSS